jgi:hypothetical protein
LAPPLPKTQKPLKYIILLYTHLGITQVKKWTKYNFNWPLWDILWGETSLFPAGGAADSIIMVLIQKLIQAMPH